MATSVTFNGNTYSIPANREPAGWGTSLSSFLVDVANSSLSKAGGNFTLTADANFGSNYGLVVKYIKSITANAASDAAGNIVRLANTDKIAFRNNANGADLKLGVSTSDRLQFESVNIPTISSSDTLTNKSIDADTNIITNIKNADIKAGAAIDVTKLADGSVSNTEFQYLNGVTSAVQTQLDAKAPLASPTFTGTVSGITASMVGLGNVDNTSDATKNAASATLTNKTITSPIIDNGLTMNHESTPATPSAGTVKVYPKSDNSLYVLDSSGVETVVGSGGGSGSGTLNIVDNPSATSATTGWTAAANYTVTRNTANSPLAGVIDSCFAIATSAASSEAATSGVYAASLAMPVALRNTKAQVSLYLTTPATSDGVWRLSVYNASATRMSLSSDSSSVTTLPASFNGQFVCTFDADSSATYTISLTQTTRTNANTLYVTNISIGNGITAQGAAVSEWQSFTLSTALTNEGTLSNTSAQWRRVGSDMEVRFATEMTTNPAGAITFTPPTGTVDTSKLSAASGTDSILGAAKYLDNGVATYLGNVVFTSGTGIRFFTTSGYLGTGTPFTWAAGDNWTAEFRVPIAEWAGSGTVNLLNNTTLAANNRAKYTGCDNTGDTWTSANVVKYKTSSFDSQSKYSVSTGIYTVPATGVYRVYGSVQWTGLTTNTITLTVRKNGSDVAEIREGASDSFAEIYDVQSCNAGDTLGIYAVAASGNPVDDAEGCRIIIERLQDYEPGSPVGFGMAGTDGSAGLYKAGQAPGQVTGVAIGTGYVGEKLVNSGSATNIPSSATWYNLRSLSLTPGVWLVYAQYTFGASVSGTITGTNANIGTSSASGSGAVAQWENPTGPSTSVNESFMLFAYVNVSSTTTYYANGQHLFSSGTYSANATMHAVRIA